MEKSIFRAAELLGSQPQAREVLRIITDQIGLTGWQIARKLSRPPGVVKDTLAALVNVDAVQKDGEGLNAYYAPSGQAYALKRQMAN